MFIDNDESLRPSSVGAQCRHCAPTELDCINQRFFYKHCVPTALLSNHTFAAWNPAIDFLRFTGLGVYFVFASLNRLNVSLSLMTSGARSMPCRISVL